MDFIEQSYRRWLSIIGVYAAFIHLIGCDTYLYLINILLSLKAIAVIETIVNGAIFFLIISLPLHRNRKTVMELRQLRYFIKVAEMLNFSAASKELSITQSTLSQQIGQLEKELSQQLFQRNSHEVMLTEAGQTLLPYARETVNSADTCVQRLNDLEKLVSGELDIGVTFSFSSIAAETIISFLKEYPHVRLNIVYLPMTDLMERLLRHELDLVLAFRPTEQNNKIESHVLFNNHLAAIVSSNHHLATYKTITLSELQRYDLALPTSGLQARNAFDRLIEGKGFRYKVKVEMNNVDMLFKVIRESNYVTVLSESTAIDEQGLCAVPLDNQDNEMEGCVHILKNTYIKNSAQEFIKMLTQSTAIYKNSFLRSI